MHFLRDGSVTRFLRLQNWHTVHPVHKLSARILMHVLYTAVRPTGFSCSHDKIIIRAALNV